MNRFRTIIVGLYSTLAVSNVCGAGLDYDGIHFPDGTVQTTAVTNEVENAFVNETLVTIAAGQTIFTQVAYTVPAGRRAVIEFASVKCETPETNSVIEAYIFVSNNDTYGATFYIPIQHQGVSSGNSTYVGGLMARIYADEPGAASGQISVSATRSNTVGVTECNFSISGRSLVVSG